MFKAQKIFRGLLLTAAIFAAGCMNNSGTEIPNGASGITGRLTDANGNPVSGAVVQMLPVDYVPSLTLSKSAYVALGTTDANGYYHLSTPDTGLYNIDCRKDTLGGFIDSVNVADNSNGIQVPDRKLTRLGSIKGISYMPFQNDTNQVRVTLYIPGTGRITKPVIGGAFTFADIPAGNYRIIIDPTLNEYKVKVFDVTVAPGQKVNLDTVKLWQGIETWELQASGTVSSLTAIVWTGSQLVAVGDLGTILTSPDGITWTIRNSGTTMGLAAITWTGSRLVAVGGAGTLISSSDGITWLSGTADARYNMMSAVIWTGNQLVAAGSTGILTSTDGGFNWVLRLTRQSFGLKSLTWASNHLVAAYNSGNPSQGGVVTSPDGITWTDITFPAGYSLSDIAWAGTEVVAATNKGILTSTDDINWTLRSPSPSSGRILWKGDETLVISGNTLVTSQDRVNWTTRILSTGITALAWTGTHLVGVGAAGIIITSP